MQGFGDNDTHAADQDKAKRQGGRDKSKPAAGKGKTPAAGMSLQLPGSKMLGGTTLPSTTGTTIPPVTSLQDLRSEVGKVLQQLNEEIELTFGKQMAAAIKGMEEQVHRTATQHYETVSSSVAESQTAIQQARDHHKTACADVKAARQELTQAIERMAQDARDEVHKVVSRAETELNRVQKKSRTG